MKQGPYRLLVVDDSSEVRRSIIDIVVPDGRFVVVGEAENGAQALHMVSELKPDIISLDIVMPGMNGITALKHLMVYHPTPIIMVSSLTKEGADSSMEAMRFGAVSFVPKLNRLDDRDLSDQAEDILTKFAWAAQVDVNAIQYIPTRPVAESYQAGGECTSIVAIGAHEGGYSALMSLLPKMRVEMDVGWIVVLYEPARHVDAFIEYLNRYTQLSVRRADDGAQLVRGVCHIASGEDYVTLRHEGTGYALHVHPAPFDSQKGSINRVMFSLADMIKDRALGIILSGSGDDGAEGLLEIHRVGGLAIVQDPQSCLVPEMPEHVIDMNPAASVLADNQMADALIGFMGNSA